MIKILCNRCESEIPESEQLRMSNFAYIRQTAGIDGRPPQAVKVQEDLCGSCTDLATKALDKVKKNPA